MSEAIGNIGKVKVSARLNEKRAKIKGKLYCSYLYLERWEEERIQNPDGGIEEGGKSQSRDLCGESEWQELRSESKIFYVAEKEMLILNGSIGEKA